MVGCLNGSLQVVQYFHSRGASLDLRSSNRSTVLHYCASSDSSELMEYLLSQSRVKGLIDEQNDVSIVYPLTTI